MNFNEVRKKAKGMGINTLGMKKTDIVHAIQRAEHNEECFAAGRVDNCGEMKCLWRIDCISENNRRASITTSV